jgi:hypothetical protein
VTQAPRFSWIPCRTTCPLGPIIRLPPNPYCGVIDRLLPLSASEFFTSHSRWTVHHASNCCLFSSSLSPPNPHSQKRCDLEEAAPRFEVFPDPIDNWIVWDRDESDVAEVGTQRLNSLSEARARAFCSLLNRLLLKSTGGAPLPAACHSILH